MDSLGKGGRHERMTRFALRKGQKFKEGKSPSEKSGLQRGEKKIKEVSGQ